MNAGEDSDRAFLYRTIGAAVLTACVLVVLAMGVVVGALAGVW